jgi:hypothetical protein
VSTQIAVLESRIPGWDRFLEVLRTRFGRRERAASRSATARSRAREEDSTKVVTVGSVVRLFDLDAFHEVTVVLAPSGRAGARVGAVSVDSALGAALLGRGAGETVRFGSHEAPRRLQVVEVRGRVDERAWGPHAKRQASHRDAGDYAPARRTSEFANSAGAQPLPTAA